MEESTAPMMEYCILFLDPLRIVWLHGAWQTPCPMPTKCPGETASRASSCHLPHLVIIWKTNKKNHLQGFKEIRTTDPTTLSHTMHCNAQYRDHISWDHRWHWVRIKSHTYGTSRMLIVSFTSQIFTMENVLVKINSIPQTLHIPISLHYSLIITTELHAAASTCCQTVDCCLCWMYRFVWTNAVRRGFYLHLLDQWERARYNTATPGPVQQFSLYFILKNLLRCHESWFSLASLLS